MVRDALRETLLARAQTGAATPVSVPDGADNEPLELVIAP
jgi:hypothetical protein